MQGSQSQIHEDLCADRIEKVTAEEICILSGELNVNKSSGSHKNPAEVYKRGTGTLYAKTAYLFYLVLESSFLPENFMRIILVPLEFNQCASENCGSIATPTSMSKLLELVLQGGPIEFLRSSNAHFGFKAEDGTEIAIFGLKETVNSNTRAGSPAFGCFLDEQMLLTEFIIESFLVFF